MRINGDCRLTKPLIENDVGGWEIEKSERPKFREERVGKPATPSMEQDYRVDPREAPSHLAALERWALAADVRMARMGADERAVVDPGERGSHETDRGLQDGVEMARGVRGAQGAAAHRRRG